MKITKEEVAKIAYLARLEFDDEKLELFAKQLNQILDYMEKLGELDTKDVEPLYSPVFHKSAYREDEVKQLYSKEDVLKNAPESDGQYFIVPKVV